MFLKLYLSFDLTGTKRKHIFLQHWPCPLRHLVLELCVFDVLQQFHAYETG